MKKALMIVAIIAIIAISGSLIYYFVFFKPEIAKAEIKLQEQKLEQEKEIQKADEIKIQNDNEYKKQQELDKEQQALNKKAALAKALDDLDKWYNEALNQAYKDYSAQWYAECIRLRWKFISPSESPLPTASVKWLNENYNQNVKNINEEYQSQKDNIFKLYE